jgi:hypothetical protein
MAIASDAAANIPQRHAEICPSFGPECGDPFDIPSALAHESMI